MGLQLYNTFNSIVLDWNFIRLLTSPKGLELHNTLDSSLMKFEFY